MGNQELDNMVRSALQLEWYSVSGLKDAPWEPMHADLLIREAGTTKQKLDALAVLIRQETGQTVAFTPQKVTRNCLILRGKTGTGMQGRRNMHSVALSLEPLNDQMRQLLRDGPRSNDVSRSTSLDDAGRVLDAPFFAEPGDHGDFHRNSIFLVMPDAHLSSLDPEHVNKLKRIAENLRAQISGEWSIEPRELEVWVMEKVQL
jgi:hypothetical protein